MDLYKFYYVANLQRFISFDDYVLIVKTYQRTLTN